MVTSKSQVKAVRNWESRNRGMTSIQTEKRHSRSFLKYKANFEDLKETQNLIDKRNKFLKEKHNLIRKLKPIFDKLSAKYKFTVNYVDLKSNLIKEKELQVLWDKFKKIKGDGILVVINQTDIYNLDDKDSILRLKENFKISKEDIAKIKKKI